MKIDIPIFKPPEPPKDIGVATQIQLIKPIKRDPEDEVYCQYCGRKLTKEDKFSHNCKTKP